MNDPRHGHPVGGSIPHPPHAPHAPHAQPHHPAGVVPRPAMPVKPVVEDDLEPISLEDDGTSSRATVTSDDPLVANAAAALKAGAPKIQAFGVSMGQHVEHQWKRALVNTGKGICRVKSFHGRLSDQGMDYLDTAINEWLDAHPEVDVKHVTTNTNLFDGKVKELALIVNIWY